MRRDVALDWETPYGKNLTVVEDGYWKYARRKEQVPYLISVCDGEEVWAGHPRDFNFDSLKGHNLISANAAFDQEIALGVIERDLYPFPHEFFEGDDNVGVRVKNWHCSSNMSSFLWNVRSLAEGVRIGLGIEVDKGTRDRAKDKSWDDMVREGWSDEMLKYARLDAQYCWQLWHRYSSQWPEIERKLSQLTIDQGRRGVAIDVDALTAAIDYLNRVIFTAQNNLPWVKRGRAPASPIGMAEECRSVGIAPPPIKAHNPDAAAEWEEMYAPKFPWVLALRNMRKAKKTLATLETIQYRLREDGTVPFSLKYAGAHTLRWAGDAGWNLQNMNKEPLFIDEQWSFLLNKDETKAQLSEFKKSQAGRAAVGTLGSGIKFLDLRGLIVARPGKVLAPADLSQIEPRVLNYLAGNHELLALVKQGLAVYEAHARSTMGWTGADLKTVNEALYALAKVRVLGLGYGAGWEKFITIAAMYGIDITDGDQDYALRAAVDGRLHNRMKVGARWVYESAPEAADVKLEPELVREAIARNSAEVQSCVFALEQRKETRLKCYSVYGMRSRTTVEDFRKSNPKIVALWRVFQDELERSVGSDLVVEGPNGYKMTYRNVRCEYKEKIDEDTGERIKKKVYTAEIGGKRFSLYGALLVENFIQWVSRNAFAENMLAMHERLQKEDPTQWVLFSVHDEAVPEINSPDDRDLRRREIEGMLGRCPDWLEGCPVAAEAKITQRYLK